MNLLAKRAGQLLFGAVLFFFLSCDDDSFLLGIKGKTKFQGVYAELSFSGDKSKVLLMDSVVTDQYNLASNTYRLLLGEYHDPEFGTVTSSVYAQFQPNDPTFFDWENENLDVDSLSVQLLFDFYMYGPQGGDLDETVTVYRLLDTLSVFQRYFFNSTAVYDPTPLGVLKLKAREIDIKYSIDNPTDQQDFLLQGRLDLFDNGEFADELLGYLSSRDSALIGANIPDYFRPQFRGLVFVPSASTRMLGFTPTKVTGNLTQPTSRLILHYHDTEKLEDDSLTTSLYFTPFDFVYSAAFNHIETQREGDLAGLTLADADVPFSPPSDKRYIQNGSAVMTALNISEFYDFTDTIEHMIINSVEISIGVETPPTGISPPNTLYAMMLKETSDGKVVFVEMDTKSDSLAMLKQYVFTDYVNFAVANEASKSSPLTLTYDSNTKRYYGYSTLFFQNLFDKRDDPETHITYVGLYPVSPAIGKSVDRAVLNANDMKLKIYYTTPNLSNL